MSSVFHVTDGSKTKIQVTPAKIQALGTNFSEAITAALGSLQTKDGVKIVRQLIEQVDADLTIATKKLNSATAKANEKWPQWNKILESTKRKIEKVVITATSAIEAFEAAKKAADAQEQDRLVPPPVTVEESPAQALPLVPPAPKPALLPPQPEPVSVSVSADSPSGDVEPPASSSVAPPVPRSLSLRERAAAFTPSNGVVKGGVLAVGASLASGSPVPAIVFGTVVTANKAVQLVTGPKASSKPPVPPPQIDSSPAPQPVGRSVSSAHVSGPALTNPKRPVGPIDLGQQPKAAIVPPGISSAPVGGPSVASLRSSLALSFAGRPPIGAKKPAAAVTVVAQPEPDAPEQEKPLAHATLTRPTTSKRPPTKGSIKFKAPEATAPLPDVITVVSPAAPPKPLLPVGAATPPPSKSGSVPAVLPPKPPAADPRILKCRVTFETPVLPFKLPSVLAEPPRSLVYPDDVAGTICQFEDARGKVSCTATVLTWLSDIMKIRNLRNFTSKLQDECILAGREKYREIRNIDKDLWEAIKDDETACKQLEPLNWYDANQHFPELEEVDIVTHKDIARPIQIPDDPHGMYEPMQTEEYNKVFRPLTEMATKTRQPVYVGLEIGVGKDDETKVDQTFGLIILPVLSRSGIEHTFRVENTHGTDLSRNEADGLVGPARMNCLDTEKDFRFYLANLIGSMSSKGDKIGINAHVVRLAPAK